MIKNLHWHSYDAKGCDFIVVSVHPLSYSEQL